MKYFYGFKNKNTGLFKPSYRTIRYKTKTACFKTEHNAVKALEYQKDKDKYFVAKMIRVEENK